MWFDVLPTNIDKAIWLLGLVEEVGRLTLPAVTM